MVTPLGARLLTRMQGVSPIVSSTLSNSRPRPLVVLSFGAMARFSSFFFRLQGCPAISPVLGEAMAGYQPSEEDRPILPRRREPANWPLFLVLGVIALGGLLWIVKPELFTPSSSETSAGEERPDTRFADLYKRYAMAPLGASVAASYDVGQALAILQKEPCNRQIAYKASTSLQEVHATRAAAEMLRGFSTACADGNNELYQASELFLVLG